jgi:hypothetical protein
MLCRTLRVSTIDGGCDLGGSDQLLFLRHRQIRVLVPLGKAMQGRAVRTRESDVQVSVEVPVNRITGRLDSGWLVMDFGTMSLQDVNAWTKEHPAWMISAVACSAMCPRCPTVHPRRVDLHENSKLGMGFLGQSLARSSAAYTHASSWASMSDVKLAGWLPHRLNVETAPCCAPLQSISPTLDNSIRAIP